MSAASRFDEDIRRACWMVKFGDGFGSSVVRIPSGDVRSDKESSLGHGGGMSAFSLPLTMGNSASKIGGQKRPPSVHALGFSSKGRPSLKLLSQALAYHASQAVNAGQNVPRENEVLALLLSPFLSGEGGRWIEEEKWVSIEIFEMMIKTWKSSSAEVYKPVVDALLCADGMIPTLVAI